VALLAAHLVLLAFPPLPPDVKGSLWSWILAVGFVLAGTLQLRSWGGRPARAWWRQRRGWRAGVGLGVAVSLLALGVGMQATLPGLHDRWSRPEGVWEALTVLAWLAAALTLVEAARGTSGNVRRHLHLLAGVFLFFVLEEVDWFGVFGGLVGRVEGVYVGAPHDLLNLALQGHLPPVGMAVVVAVGVGVGVLLLRSGHLQPRALVDTLRSPAGPWILLSALALGLAQVEDVGLVQFGPDPGLEELLEAVAGWLGAVFALEVAGREGVPGEAAHEEA
jgi:hypothetical protein